MSFLRSGLLVLTAMICCMLSGCGAPVATRAAAGGDGLGKLEVIGGAHIDLGAIDEGVGVVKNDVTLRNVSSMPILLGKNVGTSCGCTAATLDHLRLEPAESAIMTVTISTTKSAGTSQLVTATVYDDAGTRLVTCSFLNRTNPRWSVFPATLNISANVGEVKSFHFDVLGRNDTATRLLRVTSNLPRFNATISKELLSAQAPSPVEIAFELPQGSGTFNYDLVFETDDAQIPKRTLPVVLRAQTAWRIMPESVLISGDRPNPVERRLTLVGDGQAEDVTLELKNAPGISAVVLPASGGRREIQLTYTREDSSALRRGTLIVRVRAKGKEYSLTVPVIHLAQHGKRQG
jgi:hypothetical protein